MRLLLEYGASTLAVDRNGYTPEGLAAGWMWNDALVLKEFAEYRRKRSAGEL